MSELPFMTVFQVLSLPERVMNGNWLTCWMPAPLLNWCVDTLFNPPISV